MALISCPECGGQISDRAVMCPHCGFLLKSVAPVQKTRRSKRMKFPNGFGTVVKLSGNRRKPWTARVTVGSHNDYEKHRYIIDRKYLGSYETEAEAIAALEAYNKDPYDLSTNTITFREVYDRWSEETFPTFANESTCRTYSAAMKHAKAIWDMRFRDVKAAQLEGVIRDCPAGETTKNRMKTLFGFLFKYAIKHDITEKNYAELLVRLHEESKIDRIPYTWEEIQTLWQNVDRVEGVDLLLFMIYTGVRPREALEARIDNVKLSGGYFIGGLKTDAGRDRVIPIHPDIMDLVKKRYDFAAENGQEFLFTAREYGRGEYKPITYDSLKGKFSRIMKDFGMTHHPADGRHTFITTAKEMIDRGGCMMNEYLLKLVVGHEIGDVTEKYYTHRNIKQLVDAVSEMRFEPPETAARKIISL